MDRRKVFIELVPDVGKPAATQEDDGRPAPKVSAAKASAVELVKAAGAGDLPRVRELVAGKAKLDGRGQHGFTPLTAAIAGDHLEVALFLIDAGASTTATDKSGSGPLRWAAVRSGWVMAAPEREAGRVPARQGGGGRCPRQGWVHPAHLGGQPRRGETGAPAAEAGGADANARTTQKSNAGRTALMMAQGLATVRALLAAGADPTAVDENGEHTWEQQSGAAARLLKEKAGVK